MVLLGTCSCAVVRCVMCALSGFAAPGGRCGLAPVCVPWLWPAVCLFGVPRGPAWCAAPRLVCSLSVLQLALPTPWCLSPPRGLGPPVYWAAARGMRRRAGNRAHCVCRWPPPRQGRWVRSASYPFGAPRVGCPWRVLPAPVPGCKRCGGWRVWTRSLTRPVSRTVRRSTGDSAGAPGLFRVDADTSPCGLEDATPGCRACVRVLILLGRVGRAHLPGMFWCASPSLLAALSFRFAGPPPGWGCPCFGPLFTLTSPLSLFFFFRLSVLFCPAPPLSLAFPGFRPRVPWALALCVVCFAGLALLGFPCALALVVLPGCGPLSGACPPCSLPLLLFLPFLFALRLFFFFPLFLLSSAPPLTLAFCVLRPRVPWALALVCVCCARLSVLCVFFCFFLPPASWLFVRSRLFCVSPGWPVVVPRWLLHPPPLPLLCLAAFVVPARCLGFFFFLLLCAPPCLWPSLVCGPWCPGPWRCVLFVFLCLLLPGTPCTLASCVSPAWPLAAPRWLPPPPPSPFVSCGFCRSCSVPCFFFFLFSSSVRPRCLRLSPVSGPGCPGPRRCALFALLACRFSALCALSPLSCFPLGRWLLRGGCRPPPPLRLAVFVAAARCCVPYAVLCCVSLGALLRRAAARCATRCCAVVCCAALLRWFGAAACCAVPSGAARRPEALCFAVLCCAVFLRAVCYVLRVFCRGVVVRAVVCRSALCCVCPGVLCCVFPVPSARCGALLHCAGALALCCLSGACCCWRLVLWWAAVCCAVSFGVLWCGAGPGGLWLSVGGVFRCRCPCLAARSASQWLASFAVVPCFPVSCSVVLCCRVVLCCCALVSCCGAVGACPALLWPVVLCCVVLLVGCAFFCPVVVSACCGALSLVLCVPCFLRSVRCSALLCWLWCLASLCRVLCRCAVVWCCAVVFCCRFAVLFVCALSSRGLSCGAVLCCIVLLVVCAVYCPLVAFVCCGALSLPAGTHKKHKLSSVSPRNGGGVVAGMPWWLRCPGLDAAHVAPAAKGRRKRQGWGTGERGRYMAKKRGREGRVQGRSVLRKCFFVFYAFLAMQFVWRRRRIS